MEIRGAAAISDQIAYGRLRFFRRATPELGVFSRRSQEEEWRRFEWAQRQAVLQVAAFHDRVYEQLGQPLASIFAVHAMLLEDEELVESTRRLVWEEGLTAEYAVCTVGERYSAAFSNMEDPYMRARGVDVRDVARRVIFLLVGMPPSDPLQIGPAILVADTFFPSEVMELNRSRLLGLISRRGCVDSHTAMLLRAYRIPALAGVELEPKWDGHLALMNGFDHRLYLEPEPELLEELRLRYEQGGQRYEKTELLTV